VARRTFTTAARRTCLTALRTRDGERGRASACSAYKERIGCAEERFWRRLGAAGGRLPRHLYPLQHTQLTCLEPFAPPHRAAFRHRYACGGFSAIYATIIFVRIFLRMADATSRVSLALGVERTCPSPSLSPLVI